jgi:hypothetical protein
MIILEENFATQVLVEAVGNEKKTYIKGVFAESEKRNRNGRIYDFKEMQLACAKLNEAASQGRHVLGELDHRSELEVKLESVSHRIMSAEMNGNDIICKAEILEKHPKGAIAKALIDSGVQLGVSTRGSGQVNESTGRVSNFNLVTVDLVANPSAINAYPETIMEQIEMHKRGQYLMNVAEARQFDMAAEKYFQQEVERFIKAMLVK